jgi:hypothetical protein
MDEKTREKSAGFSQVQKDLMELIQRLIGFAGQGVQSREGEVQRG